MSDPHAPPAHVDQAVSEKFSGKLFLYLILAFAGFVGAVFVFVM